MKKFLKIIGVLILLVIAFVLIAGLFVSKDFHLERDITINAPQEKVWSNVNTLAGMAKWSPWTEMDPAIKTSYEGVDGTVGAVYNWEGNKEVGKGNQTLTKIEASSRVESKLHFLEPFEGHANAFINLSAAGTAATKVTWGFDSKTPYPMNVMHLFMDMDKMMGDKYNAGLSKLKTLSEAN